MRHAVDVPQSVTGVGRAHGTGVGRADSTSSAGEGHVQVVRGQHSLDDGKGLRKLGGGRGKGLDDVAELMMAHLRAALP